MRVYASLPIGSERCSAEISRPTRIVSAKRRSMSSAGVSSAALMSFSVASSACASGRGAPRPCPVTSVSTSCDSRALEGVGWAVTVRPEMHRAVAIASERIIAGTIRWSRYTISDDHAQHREQSMRMTLILVTGILCGASAVSHPHAAVIHTELTAEELVAKNIEAKGGLAKIKAIKSLRMTGRLQQGDFSATVGSEAKAPNLIRETLTIQTMTQVQAYD